MADTCSISFNRVNPSTLKVEVSTLWKDLQKEFRGDRKNAVAHYMLSQDSRFLELNGLGLLELDADGEITIDSLKRAMGYYEDKEEFEAADLLNSSVQNQRLPYLDALDNAIKFNRSIYYNRGNVNNGKYYQGLMAVIHPEDNGKYSIRIVKRNAVEEGNFAKHIQNKILTDALTELLRSHGMSVKFLEESQSKMWFDPVNMSMEDGLLLMASVLQGQESSVEVAEAVGHFLIAAMRGTPLVERLIGVFSATEEDVKQGSTKEGKSYARKLKKHKIEATDETIAKEGAVMTGEQAQQNILKAGNAETNPFYREDFDISLDNAVEAAGIVLGRQLIEPMLSPGAKSDVKKVVGKSGIGIINLIRRLGMWIGKQLRFVDQKYVNEMIKTAREAANDIVAEYLSMSDAGEILRQNFLDNADIYGASTFVHKGGISQLNEKALKCAKAYTDSVQELKSMASQLKNLLSRSGQRPENKEAFKALKNLLQEVRSQVDPNLNLQNFSEQFSRQGIATMLVELTDILSGPVAQLLTEISSDTRVDDMSKTVNDYASMRSIIAIYRQAVSMLNNLQDVASNLDINQPVYVDGQPATFTLKQAMDALEEKLSSADEGGLPRVITDQMNKMTVNWAKEFYGSDYVDMGARVLWPWEAKAELRAKNQGRITLVRAKDRKDRIVDIKDFADTLERDIDWFDALFYSASDSAEFFTQMTYKAARKANLAADRQAADFWYRSQELRSRMKDLFGTTDCRIFFEENDVTDENGNKLTGNLICAGITEAESDKDGVLYGKWEAERHQFAMKLKLDFRNYLEQLKQEFYKNPDNRGLVFYLSDSQKAALYHDFVADKWELWHAEHSVKDQSLAHKGAWIPNPTRYRNPQFEKLFPDTELGRARLRWYRQLLSLKAEMDAMLPPGATVNMRAPLIVGNLRHRYYDLRNAGNGRWRSLRKAILREMGDGVHIREDEAYLFGTNNEFNDVGQDPLQNQLFFEKDKRERLAFWGVNRLKDMSNLNTDLFSTLVNYGAMACTYQAMSSVVDIAELGKDVLGARQMKKVGQDAHKQKKGTETRTYTRYCKMLEKNVYGLNVTPPKYHVGRIALKILQGLAGLGTRFMLEYNIPGGTVNAGTGLIEVFKEAGAGEHFTGKELRSAMWFYFKNIFGNWKSKGGHQAKTDKLSLLVRHFNILGDNKQFFKTQKYDKGLIANKLRKLGIGPNWKSWIDGWGMSAYTMGEHFMQTYPYIAMAMHDKYYIEVDDGNGGKKLKEVDMIDLYDFKDALDNVQEDVLQDDGTYQTLTVQKEIDRVKLKDGMTVFLSPTHYRDHKTIQEVLDSINGLRGSGAHRPQSIVSLSMTEQTYNRLSELGLTIPGWNPATLTIDTNYAKIQQLEKVLKKRLEQCLFNENTESAFMDKCRNITDHMHGLYSTESKNAFQQKWYGALLAGMRGYLFGMVTHRFAQNRYNVAQRRSVEGFMNTAAKTYFGIFADWSNKENRYGSIIGALSSGAITGMAAHVLSFWFPAIGITLSALNLAKGIPMMIWDNKMHGVQSAMRDAGYHEQQYRNIRRCAYTYMWISGLTLLKTLLSTKFKDDDDEPYIADTSNPVMGVIYYLTSRLLREQAAYNTPHGLWDESTALGDFVPIGISGSSDLAGMAAMEIFADIDQLYGSKDQDWLYYKRGKSGYYNKMDSKARVRFLRRTIFGDILYAYSWLMDEEPEHVGRTTNVLFHGYDAAQSFDYGRRMN